MTAHRSQMTNNSLNFEPGTRNSPTPLPSASPLLKGEHSNDDSYSDEMIVLWVNFIIGIKLRPLISDFLPLTFKLSCTPELQTSRNFELLNSEHPVPKLAYPSAFGISPLQGRTFI